jgi:putative acetyltransferase
MSTHKTILSKLDTLSKNDYPVLIKIWESSVRSTHHFLGESDIENIKQLIIDKEIFNLVNLTCARNETNEIVGFLGVSEDKIEMLFIDSKFFGQGIGKKLLLHAIENLNANKVDVNEQNEQAVKFYEHFGFKTIYRSELDVQGNPFPILHMQLI